LVRFRRANKSHYKTRKEIEKPDLARKYCTVYKIHLVLSFFDIWVALSSPLHRVIERYAFVFDAIKNGHARNTIDYFPL